MAASSRPDRRRRVARGICAQPNGRYACVKVDGLPHCRTLTATTVSEARRQRELLQRFARTSERHRTLDLYGSQLRLHLLPRLGRRRLASITPDDVVAVMRVLRADGLSPWTIKRIVRLAPSSRGRGSFVAR